MSSWKYYLSPPDIENIRAFIFKIVFSLTKVKCLSVSINEKVELLYIDWIKV